MTSQRRRVDAGRLRRVGRELLQHDRRLPLAPGCLAAANDVRRHELAAVRDHRVEARHLQRRHGHVLLADRELDRVARVPGPVPVALERLLPPRRGRHDRRPTVPRCRCRARSAHRSRIAGPLLQADRRSTARARRSGCRRCRSTCRTTCASASGSVIGRLTYGSQFLKTLLVAAVRRLRRALDRLVRRRAGAPASPRAP